MTGPPNFAERLQALYEASGRPDLSALALQASKASGTSIRPQRISDWMRTNGHRPQNWARVHGLIRILISRAAERGALTPENSSLGDETSWRKWYDEYKTNSRSDSSDGGEAPNPDEVRMGSADNAWQMGSPRLWVRVPARNPHFVGRQDAIAKLRVALFSESAVTVQSLRGMGGVGKTQLATEYCHTFAAEYEVIFWILAEEAASIPDQFAHIAGTLGLIPATESEALQVQVHEHLRTLPGWLLVFDNADTVEDVQPWLPTGPMTAGYPGHAIVTTRRGGFAALGPVLEIDVISSTDALLLLHARSPGLSSSIGNEIAAELGCLPLALEQAGAYLERSAMPGVEYLQLFRQRAADLYARGRFKGLKDSIATLWDISLERIERESPASVDLLDLCAYLAAESIPLDLFTQHLALLPATLSVDAADQLTFSEAIGILVDYSLLKRDEGEISLHRLVQRAIRARHAYATDRSFGRDNPTAHRSVNQGVSHPVELVLRLLQADAPEKIMGSPKDLPRWTILFPHVMAATSHLGSSSAPPDPAASEVTAWLLDRAATYLQAHGRPGDARPLAERVRAIDQATSGSGHPIIGTDLNNLALILRDLGNASAAQPLAEQALQITEAALGSNHPDVAIRSSNLAAVLRDLGHAASALPLAERALAIDQLALGMNHPCVGARMSSIAIILQDLGQLGESVRFAEEALTVAERALGPEHPDVATDLGNLVGILCDLNSAEVAHPLAERALSINQDALGHNHPAVGTDLGKLARVLCDLGEAQEARSFALRALAIGESSHSSQHPAIATTLGALVRATLNLGQLDEARRHAERALDVAEAVLGSDHPCVATHVSDLASVLYESGKVDEARRLAFRALGIAEAARGLHHPAVAIHLELLSRVLCSVNLDSDALVCKKRANDITASLLLGRSKAVEARGLIAFRDEYKMVRGRWTRDHAVRPKRTIN